MDFTHAFDRDHMLSDLFLEDLDDEILVRLEGIVESFSGMDTVNLFNAMLYFVSMYGMFADEGVFDGVDGEDNLLNFFDDFEQFIDVDCYDL